MHKKMKKNLIFSRVTIETDSFSIKPKLILICRPLKVKIIRSSNVKKGFSIVLIMVTYYYSTVKSPFSIRSYFLWILYVLKLLKFTTLFWLHNSCKMIGSVVWMRCWTICSHSYDFTTLALFFWKCTCFLVYQICYVAICGCRHK